MFFSAYLSLISLPKSEAKNNELASPLSYRPFKFIVKFKTHKLVKIDIIILLRVHNFEDKMSLLILWHPVGNK